jgi:hypothetical protein
MGLRLTAQSFGIQDRPGRRQGTVSVPEPPRVELVERVVRRRVHEDCAPEPAHDEPHWVLRIGLVHRDIGDRGVRGIDPSRSQLLAQPLPGLAVALTHEARRPTKVFGLDPAWYSGFLPAESGVLSTKRPTASPFSGLGVEPYLPACSLNQFAEIHVRVYRGFWERYWVQLRTAHDVSEHLRMGMQRVVGEGPGGTGPIGPSQRALTR